MNMSITENKNLLVKNKAIQEEMTLAFAFLSREGNFVPMERDETYLQESVKRFETNKVEQEAVIA